MADRALVLIVASGAAWETDVLRLLGAHPGVVVLKRCVDVDDLLAAASAGQADVAVLGLDAPGLDVAATDHLRRHRVRPVAILPRGASPEAGRLRAARIGISTLVDEDELEALPAAVTAVDDEPTPLEERTGGTDGTLGVAEPATVPGPAGRVIAVW